MIYYQKAEIRMVRQRADEPYGPLLDSTEKVARFMAGVVRGKATESFYALALTAKHKLLALSEVSHGGTVQTEVEPKQVLAFCIGVNAVSWVGAHNHPSGDATPSAEDVLLTQRLESASTLMGIPMLDHLVIGEAGFYSFASRGLMRGQGDA